MRVPRLAIVGIAAIVLVAAGLGVARWRKLQAEDAESKGGISELARGRAAMAKLDRTIHIDPLPLTTRVDARFECNPTDMIAFACWGAGWEVIDWKLERDTSTDTIDALLARARAEAAQSDGPHVDAEIAGFRGYFDVNYAMRRPITDVYFTGYRDDPQGRLKMTIYANGWREETPGSTNVADAIAIMLSTEIPATGLRLPESDDLGRYRDASRGMVALLDDAKPYSWVDGAARFADAKSGATDQLREYFSRTAPVMVDVLGRRIGGHAPDAKGAMLAERLSESLFDLDPARGARKADDLARWVVGAWSPTQADASEWVEVELRLAALRTRASKDDGPGRELALRLAPMDRKLVLHDPRESLGLLADKLRGEEATRLLEAWLEPAGFPADADFASVATFAIAHLRAAPVKRHVLAMLSDKRLAGEVESRAGDVLFHGVRKQDYAATDLPPTRTTRDFRVCDVYAAEAARVYRDVTFNAWPIGSAPDKQIATIRQTLARK
jgi:hypothetical protein